MRTSFVVVSRTLPSTSAKLLLSLASAASRFKTSCKRCAETPSLAMLWSWDMAPAEKMRMARPACWASGSRPYCCIMRVRATPILWAATLHSPMEAFAGTLKKSVLLKIELKILHEQKFIITEELNTTVQRINLFEKVKIPETQENIRKIRIYLGDQQTASVVCGKISKGKLEKKRKKTRMAA